MAFYRCGGGLPTQQKNNEVAKTTNLVVTPDEGYVLEKVTVAPTPSEPGSGTAPASGSTDFNPSSGKYFNKFTVTATPTEAGSDTSPTSGSKVVYPSNGKHFSQFTINAPTTYGGSGTSPTSGTKEFTPTSGTLFNKFTVTAPTTETRTLTAGTSAAPFTATSGKLISGGIVEPTPSETAEWTATTASKKEIIPSSGKLLSKVTIYPQQHSATYSSGTNQIVLPDVHNFKTIKYNNSFKSDCIWLSPRYDAIAEYGENTVQIGYNTSDSLFKNCSDIYATACELFRQNSYGLEKTKPGFNSNFSIYDYDLIVIAYANDINAAISADYYSNEILFTYFSPKLITQKQTFSHVASYTKSNYTGEVACLNAINRSGRRVVELIDRNHIKFHHYFEIYEDSAGASGSLSIDDYFGIPISIFGIQYNNAIGISANCSLFN